MLRISQVYHSMRKNVFLWPLPILASAVFFLLLNTSPLSRLGLSIQLPNGWQAGPVSTYDDASCTSRHAEGIPFTFKRPNKNQSCTFDTNMLALLLNCVTGATLGFGYMLASNKKHRAHKDQEIKYER